MPLFKEHQPGLSSPNLLLRGVVLIAILGVVYTILYSRGIPFAPKGGTVVRAQFTTAENVSPGKTPVRMHGVLIGKVEKVQRAPGRRGVIVTMRLDKTKGYTLKRDATAHILWRTLLGFNFYIDIDPGSPGAPPLGGATIPLKQTTTQVELDQLLASLTPPTRAGLQTTFHELGKGFEGSAAGGAIDAAAPAMRELAPGLQALRGTRPGDLTRLVGSTRKVAGALARADDRLGGLIDGADTTLAVTAARRAALASILRTAPQTMDDARATFGRIRSTLDTVDPVVDHLRPGVRALPAASMRLRPALRELRPVLADARPLLRRLVPAVRNLGGAAGNGTPFLDGLRPTLDRLNATLFPWADTKDASTGIKNYESIGPVAATVASSASLLDQYGYTQRFGAGDAISERSGGFSPCSTNLEEEQVDCQDVQRVLSSLFGIAPATTKRKDRR